MKAVDVAGNENVSSVLVIVDLIPPEFIDVSPENCSYVQSKVLVSWNIANDNEIDHYEIGLDNG